MAPIELVSVGHTAADTQITPDGKVRTTLGGGGFSPAVAASTVLPPERIGLITNIGTDVLGQQALEYLSERGINRDGVVRVENGQTTWVVLMEFSPGNRRIAVDPGVSQNFHLSVPLSYMEPQYIHLGSGPAHQQLKWFQELKTICSPQTLYSVDPLEIFMPIHPEETKEIFHLADIIFINEQEMELLRQFGEDISTEKQLVLKLGAKGVVYQYHDTHLEIPAPQVQVIHTTGAGEVIAGVFLGLRAQNIPVDQALSQAVRYASLSVTDYGIQHLPETIASYPNSS